MTESQKFKMGHVSFGDALTSNDLLCNKSEVSIFSPYKDMKDNTKCRNNFASD